MMSTSRGTPEKPYFLLSLARISFRETDSLASCALMSSAAIAEVTRSNCSACEGPMMVALLLDRKVKLQGATYRPSEP